MTGDSTAVNIQHLNVDGLFSLDYFSLEHTSPRRITRSKSTDSVTAQIRLDFLSLPAGGMSQGLKKAGDAGV